MGASLEGFDASKVEPDVGFKPIPIGRYTAVILSAERKNTKANDGAYLNLKVQVVDGEFKGRTVFNMLHLWNQKETARQIAEGQLSAICRAIGVITPKSTDDLLNKPLCIDVGHDEYNGKIKNVINCWSKVGSPDVNAAAPADDGKPGWMG